MRREETVRKIVTEEREITIKKSVTCNKCGKTIEPTYANDMVSIYTDFGYESNFDGEKWSFDICDDCLLEIIKTFKHVPDGFFDDNSELSEEIHQKVFDDWKETGEWEHFKYHTYEQLESLNGYYSTEYLNEFIKKYHEGRPLLTDEYDL